MWAVEDPDEKSEIQRSGLSQSIHGLLDIIKAEEALVPRDKIFLCGISQGFATALSALLTEGQGGFAGLIGLCSWMPFVGKVEELLATAFISASGSSGDTEGAKTHQPSNEVMLFSALQAIYHDNGLPRVSQQNQQQRPLPSKIKTIPLFLGHAVDDSVVPLENARRMKKALSDLGLSVDWHEYGDGGHWVNEPQGVDEIVGFVKRCL